MESQFSWSDLPSDPSYGSNWDHKNSRFGSFAFYLISIVFTALEHIERK